MTIKFPTPDELARELEEKAAPAATAILQKIHSKLTARGAVVSLDTYPDDATRALVEKAPGEAGWSAAFGSDQRYGSSVRVSPMLVMRGGGR